MNLNLSACLLLLSLSSTGAHAMIRGVTSYEESIVRLGSKCSGVLIAKDKVLTSELCVQSLAPNAKIRDILGESYAIKHKWRDRSVYKNHLAISGQDLMVIELDRQVGDLQPADGIYELRVAQEAFDEAKGPIIPESDLLKFYSFGKTDMSSTQAFAAQNTGSLNFRYWLSDFKVEAVFGSKPKQLCGADRGGALFYKGKVLAIASRPILKDTSCGEHLSWIFTSLASRGAEALVKQHDVVDETPHDHGGQDSSSTDDGQGATHPLIETYAQYVDVVLNCNFQCPQRASTEFAVPRDLRSFELTLTNVSGNGFISLRGYKVPISAGTYTLRSHDFLNSELWQAGTWPIEVETSSQLSIGQISFDGLRF